MSKKIIKEKKPIKEKIKIKPKLESSRVLPHKIHGKNIHMTNRKSLKGKISVIVGTEKS